MKANNMESKHKNTKEKVFCSAIRYKNFTTQVHLPNNIDKWLVIRWTRHFDIAAVMLATTGLRSVESWPNSVWEYVQWFMTSKNRFLDRKEALILALEAKQVSDISELLWGWELSSEDLW